MLDLHNHPLTEVFFTTIVSGLKRRSIITPARWAEEYRVMGNPIPGPMGWKYHPWLYEMHLCTAEKAVGQKAAQLGYTEWAMNTAFFNIDVRGMDVLYILPTSDDASDFSAGRFDPALELSPRLHNLFGDVNNVGLKRAGSNILYVRGSHSRSKLKSIPCPVLIFDEVDEMGKGCISLAEERQSGQFETVIRMLSTPTIENHGINEEFKLSDQCYYVFKCPSCSKYIMLEFPDSLVITADSLSDPNIEKSHFICLKCKYKLPCHTTHNGAIYKPWLKHKDLGGTGRFEAQVKNPTKGFHVNQFYSMAKVGNPAKLAEASIRAERDPTRAQEWYNSKGGVCYTASGARITDVNIKDCIQNFRMGPTNENMIRTMGIDIGAVLHIVIKEWTLAGSWLPGISKNDLYDARIIYIGETSGAANDFSNEAWSLFVNYRCHAAVVDAEPERRAALQFAHLAIGRIFLCDYLYSQQGRDVQVDKDALTLKCNRTSWLDLTLGRYRNKTVQLPVDTPLTFKQHIKEPTRVYREDKFGNPYGVYVSVGPDHYAHSDTYAELALPLAIGLGNNQDITDAF